MHKRRLPLPLLLVVLPLVVIPVPAQADDHNMECFTGLTPEKEQAVAARLSCGILVYGQYAKSNDAQGTVGTNGSGEVMKGSFFAFAEAAEYVAGRDSGESLDGWMLGIRYSFLGEGTIEPFFHVMGGRVRPSRPIDVPDDNAATDWTGAGVIGFGVEIEAARLVPGVKRPAVVPVFRLQIEGVDTGANDFYVRGTVGVSFRFEGWAHK